MNIIYVNSAGAQIDLSDFPYCLQVEDILNYEWSYDSADHGNYGSKVTRFFRNKKEIETNLIIHSSTHEDFREKCQHFFEVTEYDILNNSPGKLVLNDGEYINCYIVGVENSYWHSGIKTNVKSIKLMFPSPFWYKASAQIPFGIDQRGGVPSDPEHVKYYPHGYDYDYYNTSGVTQEIINDNIDGADFIMLIDGPAEDPYVTIGETTYQINADLSANEKIEINTLDKKLTKINADATRENVFQYRGLDDYIFEKIPPGLSNVSWPGNFAFFVTMYQKRSEPKWNYSTE